MVNRLIPFIIYIVDVNVIGISSKTGGNILMKKIKRLISVIAGISMLAMMFTGCPSPNSDTPDKPISGPEAEPTSVSQDFTQPDLKLDANKPHSSWEFVTYGMNEFAGKDVVIELSCDVAYKNNTSDTVTFKWQINDNSTYPEIVTFDVAPGEDTIHVSGKNGAREASKEFIPIKNGNLLYLSTNNATYDITMDITNIKYTVTYGSTGDEPAPEPAKKYPTDIFKVGEKDSCGITVGDEKFKFVALEVAASDVTYNKDGSVTYIATAAGGGGGGVAFYVKDTKKEINLANYESIDIEIAYSPITGSWAADAQQPGFALRILPYDSTGVFGGYVDMEYFDTGADYNESFKKNFKITEDVIAKIKDSSKFDSVLGFVLKFNDYNRGNSNGDQLKVQVKNIKFNKKAGAPADIPFDGEDGKPGLDGLTAAEKGTVVHIDYPSSDWLAKSKGEEPGEPYNKPAWVYLPAGYDPEDKDTKYPILVLMHGYGQNQNTWGLSDKGRGGKIKGFMDRGMKDGSVKKFICVVPTGLASRNYTNNNDYFNTGAWDVFGGELRNDLLPYMRENFNVADGRENVAMAGLSYGGKQTLDIGIAECLDLISYFGAFSFPFTGETIKTADEKFPDLKIKQLYIICGTADSAISGFRDAEANFKVWDKVENFASEEYEGGTHDFPVWFRGFEHLIPLLFK